MRRSWALHDGDLDLRGGRLARVEGAAAVEQHIRQRLRHFQGDWFLGLTTIGFPYDRDTLILSPSMAALEKAFRDYILATPGVTGFESFQIEFGEEQRRARRLDLYFVATTLFGNVTIREAIEASSLDVVANPGA